MSLLEVQYFSGNDLASKCCSYRLWLQDNLLSTHRYLSIYGEGGMNAYSISFWGWQTPLRERIYLFDDWMALKMKCHNLIWQRAHISEEILLKKSFQELEGNLREMGLIGDMKSQTEDGWKGNKDGRRTEAMRRRLQKENQSLRMVPIKVDPSRAREVEGCQMGDQKGNCCRKEETWPGKEGIEWQGGNSRRDEQGGRSSERQRNQE